MSCYPVRLWFPGALGHLRSRYIPGGRKHSLGFSLGHAWGLGQAWTGRVQAPERAMPGADGPAARLPQPLSTPGLAWPFPWCARYVTACPWGWLCATLLPKRAELGCPPAVPGAAPLVPRRPAGGWTALRLLASPAARERARVRLRNAGKAAMAERAPQRALWPRIRTFYLRATTFPSTGLNHRLSP